MNDNISNVLEYKGYKGSIEIDTKAEILFGHIQNLKNPGDLVSYEGETIKQLKKDFENAVDEYIANTNEIVKGN